MAITSKPNSSSSSSFSSSSSSRYQVRSISLPCRSHPTTIKLEQELNKLKTWEAAPPTEKSIRDGLMELGVLYKCMEELLNLPLTRQALSLHQNEKWVNELLDGSVRFLDICGRARDMVAEFKEHIRVLQCALRRRWKGDESFIESNVSDYLSFRKKIKKDAKRLITDLNQVDNCRLTVVLDHHVIALVRVLVSVSETTSSMFESILIFFSVSISKPKSTRWSNMVSKLIQKGTSSTCEDHQEGTPMNELECADVALLNLCKNCSSSINYEGGDRFQIAQNRLEAIENQIENLDSGLECIFRCLIRSRASMLNILSQ